MNVPKFIKELNSDRFLDFFISVGAIAKWSVAGLFAGAEPNVYVVRSLECHGLQFCPVLGPPVTPVAKRLQQIKKVK